MASEVPYWAQAENIANVPWLLHVLNVSRYNLMYNVRIWITNVIVTVYPANVSKWHGYERADALPAAGRPEQDAVWWKAGEGS
jgi:hypothetical protein